MNAVCVPTWDAVKSAQVLAASGLNSTWTTYSPRWVSIPELAFLICSPLMIDLSSRYTWEWSVEQVTRGRFGSSLPARTSSSLQRVAWNCNARIWICCSVLCRNAFSSVMR